MNRLKSRLPFCVYILASSMLSLGVNAQEFKCADGAILTAQTGDTNRAFNAINVEPIKSLHEKVTRQSPPWLAKIDGPADINMMYEVSGKPPIMVMSWCANHECDTRYAFAALENNQYAIDVMDKGNKVILGTLLPNAVSAMQCKRAYIESKKWKR